MRRQTALSVLVVAGVVLLLGSYLMYTQRVLRDMQSEAKRLSQMFSVVYTGLTDTTTSGAEVRALSDLSRLISEAQVPLVVTDAAGHATQCANVPPDIAHVSSDADCRSPANAAALAAYVRVLDAQNPPVRAPLLGEAVHYGSTRLARGLSIIPAIQVGALAVLLIGAILLVRAYDRAGRDRVWAGMARESAHQIGTPLSSLHGWMEMLRERAGDPLVDSALDHMGGDVERLERVAHRFERIGRPPKREPVDVAAMVERVVSYFQARVPSKVTPVHFTIDVKGGALSVSGDRVLLEWVLESLIKNAVDALAGSGGTVALTAGARPGGQVYIRVADDGPGVPAALRRRIFDAGFTTKDRGWGIGLALTRRIVEENHGGKLVLAPSTKGAAFDVILPA
ncbi:MAG TPA: HAMP domain-containing sensor histidine kinase [Gemmatimonadaceae bacterium]|nr:HAMP domain-containing sensor histidine kinase [Gemmatimonadaceae bacterium]